VGAIGLVLAGIGSTQLQSGNAVAGVSFMLLGIPVCIVGLGQYAKGKGYSSYWAVLGLLWIVGFIILFFFPDRHKQQLPKSTGE
jgi:energy-converting hydrogenase Eha subunit G